MCCLRMRTPPPPTDANLKSEFPFVPADQVKQRRLKEPFTLSNLIAGLERSGGPLSEVLFHQCLETENGVRKHFQLGINKKTDMLNSWTAKSL